MQEERVRFAPKRRWAWSARRRVLVLATSASRPCRLSVLGNFELDAGPAALPVRDSGARLLAFLATRGPGRVTPRSAVAEHLWAESDPGHAGARLRSTLWRLPRLAGRPLVTSGATSLSLAEFVDVDLWAAEDLAASLTVPPHDPTSRAPGEDPTPDERPADDADLEVTAWRRLGADLLPDWEEDWLVIERESFRQTRLHALERASALLCRAGAHGAALQAALRAVACEPLRETAHRRVIEVHLAEGNPAEALRQYQTYRRLLASELGLAPTPAIRASVAPLLGRPLDSAGSARVAR
jgi:DNA-binding SARP family transcriptional activator